MALRWAAMNVGEKVSAIATLVGAALLVVCALTGTMEYAIVLPTLLVVGYANAYLYWRSMRGPGRYSRSID